MNLFQRFMNKHFGWKYAIFHSLMGTVSIERYHELPNGILYTSLYALERVMLPDGKLSVEARFNCEPVRWEHLS